MAHVTVEGSKTNPSTFLAPGARITVERTRYIDKLIARGYITVVPAPSAVEHVEQIVETQRKAASDEQRLTGAPAESAAKSVWADFLGIEDASQMTKAEMIEQWNSRGADSPSVD